MTNGDFVLKPPPCGVAGSVTGGNSPFQSSVLLQNQLTQHKYSPELDTPWNKRWTDRFYKLFSSHVLKNNEEMLDEICDLLISITIQQYLFPVKSLWGKLNVFRTYSEAERLYTRKTRVFFDGLFMNK